MSESDTPVSLEDVGSVVIGRNEGTRLQAALRSVCQLMHRVYVDSGSTDDSPQLAGREGARVVNLPVPPQFTAARARNAGLAALLADAPDLQYVQMLDGDCELAQGWLQTAALFLDLSPDVAAVFGRLRERNPQVSLYNRLCDAEWDGPIGPVASCGGIAFFRVEALRAAGGYTESLIAGEEPDLCLRIRGAGWTIVRIDAEMALHDAAMIRLAQFWRRAVRGGHAFAELAQRHGQSGDPKWRRQLLSIAFWAAALPLAILLALVGAAASTAAALAALGMLLLYPVQVSRIARHLGGRLSRRDAIAGAALMMFGKFAQLFGAALYWHNRWQRRPSMLIEHK